MVTNRIQQLKTVRLDQLDPFSFGNPRVMEDRMRATLRASMQEFGIVEPIVVRRAKDGDRYEILNGHHRYAELKELNEPLAQVVVVDLPDDTKARALVLALNRISANWDQEALVQYVDELINTSSPSWVTEVTGFTAAELESLASAGTEFLAEVQDTISQNTEAEATEVTPPNEHVTVSLVMTPEQHQAFLATIKAHRDKGMSITDTVLHLLQEKKS